jgi:hypothetical protein
VRVLEIWEEHGFLYLKIRDNKIGKIGTISQRISDDYLADEFLSKNDKKGTEIEFDF